MDIVNEGQTWLLTVTFKDEDGTGVTPSAANYRIDDDDSATAIVGSAGLSPSSSVEVITITAAQNAMVDATKTFEMHTVTVDFTYSGKTGQNVYKFALKNLNFVT